MPYLLSESDIERFWAKVERGDDDDCWSWLASTYQDGYGCFHLGSKTDGSARMNYAHRIAYQLGHGPIPDGLHVLHSCPNGDNPRCCNPRHLRAGTKADNSRDMWERGRAPIFRGSQNGNSRLTESDVTEIRQLLKEGMIQKVIAQRFGVNQTVISSIARGVTWKHVPPSNESDVSQDDSYHVHELRRKAKQMAASTTANAVGKEVAHATSLSPLPATVARVAPAAA